MSKVTGAVFLEEEEEVGERVMGGKDMEYLQTILPEAVVKQGILCCCVVFFKDKKGLLNSLVKTEKGDE